ncbi:MAG TPA: NlpC/P60 family protein [Acidimicrobiales bacterium]|nr:NlpC/P60 family protein [Acidimicrobiales bacterium]
MADGVATAKAQAAALQVKIQTIANDMSAASQQYDNERNQVATLTNRIRQAKSAIGKDKVAVVADSASLQSAAVNAYITSGSMATTNPLFAQNANELGPTSVYNQVAEGNLSGDVATFTNAQQTLAVLEGQLNQSKQAAQLAVGAERRQLNYLAALKGQVSAALASANAEVQQQLTLLHQAQLAAAQLTFTQGAPTVPNQSFPAPPPNSKANIAVDTALSFLGVKYCWGGASRACVDCSGLTMLSWEAAGVDLPHYSGDQFADSTPVPLFDLMPGDLLFYGPGGDEHVAMYVGHGTMIEAPYTGAYVWLTPVRFGYGFAGAGRP